MRKFLYTTIAILISLVIIFVLFMSYANYSDGSRAGVVVKMSKRGYIFKTYEGQLNAGGVASSGSSLIPTVWDFSVKRNKEDIVKSLEDAQMTGERVKLYYKEKYFKFPWIADTKYYVYKVEKTGKQSAQQQGE
jgi:hypothetical protein